MGATRTYEFDTERDKDAQAVFERSQQVHQVKLLITEIINKAQSQGHFNAH